MRPTLLMLSLFATVALAVDPEPKDPNAPRARVLDIKGLKMPVKDGGAVKPQKIATAKELTDAVPDKDAQTAIAKKVNFAKEYLLLFVWSGSGGDRLAFEVTKGDKGEQVVFKVKRGLTRDYRRHAGLYAIPAKMGHKMTE